MCGGVEGFLVAHGICVAKASNCYGEISLPVEREIAVSGVFTLYEEVGVFRFWDMTLFRCTC